MIIKLMIQLETGIVILGAYFTFLQRIITFEFIIHADITLNR